MMLKYLSHTTQARAHRVLVGAISLLCLSGALAQAPSQKPLLSRDGGGVKPNVVINLDNSTSMAYQYSPEGAIKVGGGNVYLPDGTGLIGHKDDTRWASGFFSGTVLADPNDTSNIFQRQQRSPDVNTIYYNPERRYLPWANADGTRMAQADINAAKLDPIGHTTNATVDLNMATTGTIAPGSNGYRWCTAISSGLSLTCTTSSKRFQPALYYRLKKNADGSYKSGASASNYIMFNLGDAGASTTYTKYPDRTDCVGSECTRDEERQNYANWFVYYRSRLLLAQGAIPEAFVAIENKLRLGWGDIHKGSSSIDGVSTAVVSQGVRELTLAHKTAFFNWIRTIGLTGGTPLREAMYGVGQYYSRADNGGPWSDDPASSSAAAHKTCRRAYHILVTDGDWNTSGAPLTLPNIGNVDNTSGSQITGPGGREYSYVPSRPFLDSNSNYLADVAMRFWRNDLRPDPGGIDNKVQPTADNPAFWQHMVNYTVAMGLTGLLNPATDLEDLQTGAKQWSNNKIDDLWHAAINSRGQFFNAKDAGQLAEAIRFSLNQAVERELLEAGVATASTILEANNRKYIPSYKTGVWIGDVNAYSLDSQGQTGVKIWSAAAKLPPWNQRKIVTFSSVGTTTVAATFTFANLDAAAKLAMGESTTSTLVDFIRGDRSNEGSTSYRERESILGDFINTTPIFAKDGYIADYLKLPSIGNPYALYVNNTKKNRQGVLYVGANDGMLHAFLETKGSVPTEDGKEIFAFIPRSVYGSLSNLASRTYGTTGNYHSYFVDGPLRETDAFVPPPGGGDATWRNYLLGSTGAGARAVFAIDITDPAALTKASLRWEISSATNADMGYVTFPIASGVLPSGKWVALFGNGYGSTLGLAKLMVVDMATGAVATLPVGNEAANGLGGVAVQLDDNGYLHKLYAGDLKGKLWEFELDSGHATGFRVANGGTAFFSATDSGSLAQPIFQPPVLFNHSQGGKIVVFGTGRLITEADADTTTVQAMYGVRAKAPESLALPLTRSNLAVRTITSFAGTGAAAGQTFFDVVGDGVDWSTQRGWHIDLTVTGYTGLRIIYPPQAAGPYYVLFSAVSPAQNLVACESSTGKGINFLFPVETGMSHPDATFDTTGDGVIDSAGGGGGDARAAGYAANADGVDAVLTSATGNLATDAESTISIQNTTGQVSAKVRGRPDDPPSCTPPDCPCGTPPCGEPEPPPPAMRDRVWQRIINPPIR